MARKIATVRGCAFALWLCVVPVAVHSADLGLVIQPNQVTQKAAVQKAVDAAKAEPILQPAEPITGGESYDSDDTYFMDVNLSLKIRLTPAPVLPRIRPFLSMSTRFGFYWGSRPGSPVIGKSYNPELFFRFLPQRAVAAACDDCKGFEYSEFFNFGYAHQSNGQLIHTAAQYEQQLKSTPPSSYADNFIHRGWDYLDAGWKRTFRILPKDLTLYAEGKYFLPRGFLQGPEDQYHAFEASGEGKPRDAVDGLELTVDWPSQYAHFAVDCPKSVQKDCEQPLSRPNLTLRFLTGYQSPFRYDTVRGEFGFQLYSLPLALWVQHGYMSSLAQYYRKVDSVGIEVRFETF